MGRKVDLERAALVEKLGVSKTKNWSKKELLEMEAKRVAKEEKAAEKKAMTDMIAGPPPTMPAAELQIPYDLRTTPDDPFNGLTERQKNIARLRMRGLSQQTIANLVGVAQPIISKELARIKEWQAEQGASVDQAATVGHVRSVYSEVTEAAWLLFSKAQNAMLGENPNPNAFADSVKALAVVTSSTQAHTKFLMDMGMLKKAAQEIKHVIEPSPFIANWKDGSAKKKLADTLVSSQLPALPEPTPDDVIEGEVQEQEVDIVVPAPKVSDLAEPTPDVEEIELEAE